MFDDVKDNYVEAISSTLPLHRFVIVVFGFLCAIAIGNQEYRSIIETILRFQISKLSFEEDMLFEHATLFDCMWGLILCLLSFACYKLLSNFIFLSISTAINYDQRIATQRLRYAWISALSQSDKNIALIRIEKRKKVQQKKLRWRSVAAELAIAFCVAMAASAYWGNALDAALAFAGFVFFLAIQGNLIYVFLRDYLGSALQESMLEDDQAAISPPD